MTSVMPHPVDVSDRPAVDIMSRPVFAISAGTTLDQALRALLVAGLRHLVVVDALGSVVGVISDRQVAAAWARDPDGLTVLPAAAVLDSSPPTVSRSATLQTVAGVMRDHRTDVVVVVDRDRRPVGVLTAGDVVAAVARPKATT